MKPADRRRLRLILGICGFYTVLWLLWLTPVVLPLRIFVVLLHEMSHGLAAAATGGSVERIVLYADEGGATHVRGGNAFITLSAGYLGSLLWGLGLIEVARARPRRARMALGALGIFILFVAAFYVRNLFGFLFAGTFGVILIAASRRLRATGVATSLLVLGLTSALYALLDIRSDIISRPHVRSDAYMLGEITGLPTLFWGFLWIGLALGACVLAVRRWLRG